MALVEQLRGMEGPPEVVVLLEYIAECKARGHTTCQLEHMRSKTITEWWPTLGHRPPQPKWISIPAGGGNTLVVDPLDRRVRIDQAGGVIGAPQGGTIWELVSWFLEVTKQST